jgi:hypothetical protein
MTKLITILLLSLMISCTPNSGTWTPPPTVDMRKADMATPRDMNCGTDMSTDMKSCADMRGN